DGSDGSVLLGQPGRVEGGDELGSVLGFQPVPTTGKVYEHGLGEVDSPSEVHLGRAGNVDAVP
ncbi:MAG: hypothetical protein OTJ97_08060, partial [SAR202 cluster bacterium]|nr:hypothetical protein [SAR202 cluster bacterium]